MNNKIIYLIPVFVFWSILFPLFAGKVSAAEPDPIEVFKFDCNEQGECVRNPNGRYTSSVCFNNCQPLSDSEETIPEREPFSQSVQPHIPTEGLPDFGQLVTMIFTWSLNVLGIVVFVMIFYSGFKWFTAAGNTAKVNEARDQITNAITGAIILLAAWIILYTINPDLVRNNFPLPGIGASQTR